jgi:hypothetical protein
MHVLQFLQEPDKKKPTKEAHPLKLSETHFDLDSFFYSDEAFDQLSRITLEGDTQKLINMTSLNIVQCGVRVFRIMREIQRRIIPISQDDLRKAARTLRIQPQQDPDGVFPTISPGDTLRLILERDPERDPNYIRRIAMGQIQRPNSRPVDLPLHILIFYLREHLKAKTKRPHNRIICGFLMEQDISEKSESAITKSARKDADKMREVYEFFRDVYENPVLFTSSYLIEGLQQLNRIAVSQPEEMRDASLFPPWQNYIPETPS